MFTAELVAGGMTACSPRTGGETHYDSRTRRPPNHSVYGASLNKIITHHANGKYTSLSLTFNDRENVYSLF